MPGTCLSVHLALYLESLQRLSVVFAKGVPVTPKCSLQYFATRYYHSQVVDGRHRSATHGFGKSRRGGFPSFTPSKKTKEKTLLQDEVS